MGEYVSRFHRQEDQEENRKSQIQAQLVQLGLNEVQYKIARSHPIYFEVLKLALMEVPIRNFWVAQYQWLGIEGETIDQTGQVRVEFHHNNFDDERNLYLSMFDE